MDESGAILARSRSGASNPSRVALDAALEAVIEAAEKALATAGKTSSDVANICGAIAGAGLAGAIPDLREGLKLKFPKATSVFVGTDLSMALTTAGEPPCVVVIAGTGSAVIGRDTPDNLAREGGLGPILGDPGSAYDIGRKAMILALSQNLSGKDSYLGKEILNRFQCNWIELQARMRAKPDSVLPEIFPLVAKAANEGDEAARSLLRSAAEELSELVILVVDRLNLRAKSFFLAKTGGVFNRSRHFDAPFDDLVGSIAPHAKIGPLPVSIAEFCARAARDCLDSPIINVGD
jgi:glucosamine kinase